jgi:alkylated DNA nucleotide flippase Atl1
MSRKRTAVDHLAASKAPHIVHMIPPGAPGFREAAGGAMVISSPAEVDDYLRRIRPGEVATLGDLRAAIARAHQVAVACPVSTAIFANMAARAAEERRALGEDPAGLTPWWRLLKAGGFLNDKAPGGGALQAQLLGAEGVRASPLRTKLAVFDFEARLAAAFRPPPAPSPQPIPHR